MNNLASDFSPASLRRYWRQFLDYLRYIIPEFLVIAGSVFILLGLIKRFFFVR